jgi:hypothetical protein
MKLQFAFYNPVITAQYYISPLQSASHWSSLEPQTSDRVLILGEGFLDELDRVLDLVEGFLGELNLVLELVEGFLEELKLVLVLVELFGLLVQQLCPYPPPPHCIRVYVLDTYSHREVGREEGELTREKVRGATGNSS